MPPQRFFAANFHFLAKIATIVSLFCILRPRVGDSADRSESPPDGKADRATFVILAPAGPVLADLKISVAGRSCRRWIAEFLSGQLDADRSSTLDASELELLTDRIRAMVGVRSVTEILQNISRDDTAASVSTDAFIEWVNARLPKVFSIIALPRSPVQAVRLTPLIDLNQDSAVSPEELSVAVRTLRLRDLDDDETFSITELLPFRDPLSQRAAIAPGVAGLPFIEIADPTAAEACADVLLNRWGTGGTLPLAALRLNETQRQTAGFSQISALDRPALVRFLQQPTFHLTVDVRLSDKANRSDVAIQVADGAEEFCHVTRPAFGRMHAALDGMSLTIIARGGGANNRAFSRGFLGQSFTMSDKDQNQYLDAQEFLELAAALGQAEIPADYSVIDTNRDAMVTRDEVFRFADRDFVATASRIEVTVVQDGRTLFSLIDQNADRRLSRRELLEGKGQLQTYDTDRDGRFTESELGTAYQLMIGLGRTEARRASGAAAGMMDMQNGPTDAILPETSSISGPEWFRRMDRNRDGDVSLREFPGPAATFAQVDTNADGLISSSEAESVTSSDERTH